MKIAAQFGTQDLKDNFTAWATFGDASNASGFFGNGNFPVTDLENAASRRIYLMVTDTIDPSAASQIAVFTNTSDSDWNFPASDLGFTPSVSTDDIVGGATGSSLLAGTITTSPLTSGGPAIRLAAVPEPTTISLTGLLAVSAMLRRRR